MKKELKILLWGAAGLVALFSVYLILVFSFWLSSDSHIYPGVSVAGINLSGKTKEQAIQTLKENLQTPQINFEGTNLENLEIAYNIEATAQKALEVGRDNPFILGKKIEVAPDFSYNIGNLYAALKSFDIKNKTAVVNAKVVETNGFEIKEGKAGKHLNYAESVHNFKKAVLEGKSNFSPAYVNVMPTFNGLDVAEHDKEIAEMVPESLELTDGEKVFKVPRAEVISWTTLTGENKSYSRYFYGEKFLEPVFGLTSDSLFSEELIGNYLSGLSKDINKDSKNAILGAQEDKVIIAVAEVNGRELNIQESAQQVSKMLSEKETSGSLVVDVKKAQIRTDSLSELGLVDLISVGSSNFTGSPVNRIHNIQTGASKFNGVLIRPDEEFSFNTTLGPVDASTGYRPELVILENKTQPQFGGGLCQVSSTAFRAALNAGLPITARKAHAYPVSYYKPYGVDATIYLPNPDLKFKNDTGRYIYMQTRIVGKNLYFDFYGTKTGRKVSFSGNENGAGGVFPVEKVTPFIYDQGARGNGSFSTIIYRFVTDTAGKTTTYKWVSKYDSPDKYPH